MTKKITMAVAVISGMMCLSAPLMAQDTDCSLTLSKDLQVSEPMIVVLDGARELYRIEGLDRVVIDGKTLTLTPQARQSAAAFAAEVRQSVPEVRGLMERSLDVVNRTLRATITELFGEDSTLLQQLDSLKQRLQQMWDERWQQQGDTMTVKRQDSSQWNSALNKLLDSALVQASMAGVKDLLNGNDEQQGSLAQRMQQLTTQVKQRLQPQLDALQEDAMKQCRNFADLDRLETRMQQQIPQLATADLISVKI